MTNGTEPSEAPRRLPRWRRALVAIFVIVSVVLVPLAGLSVWVRNLVLDTDKYVETVAPLGREKAITDLVAERATDRLFQQVDVAAEAKDALPERAQFLAGPLSTGVETFVREAAKRALASEQFATVWREANRRAHALVVKALTDEGNVSIKNDKVVLDLSAEIDAVIKRLDERGVTVFDNLSPSQKNLQVELFDAGQLDSARSAVHLLDRARIVLVVLVFVLLGAALALSGNRRRTLMRWGIGLVVAMAVTAALLALGRSAYLGVAKNHEAAAAAFDILVRYLRNGIRVIAALGIIVALAAFLSGPSRLAVRIREGARGLIGGAGRKADEAGWTPGPVGTWVAAHKVGLRILGVAVAFLVVFVLTSPRPLTLLVLALLLLVYVAAIEFVGRTAEVADGTPTRGSS
jgi:lipopolysaccharide export system permease LptF/LptG-like protein